MFLNQQGRPLTWNSIRVRINEYRLKAGIKKPVGLHAFRRSCATHMLQQGADIRYIQKLLGHKYLKTTQLYTKVVPTDVKKTHDKTHPGVKGKRRKAKGQRLKKDKSHED
jgi:site-specific recombinase XerD